MAWGAGGEGRSQRSPSEPPTQDMFAAGVGGGFCRGGHCEWAFGEFCWQRALCTSGPAVWKLEKGVGRDVGSLGHQAARARDEVPSGCRDAAPTQRRPKGWHWACCAACGRQGARGRVRGWRQVEPRGGGNIMQTNANWHPLWGEDNLFPAGQREFPWRPEGDACNNPGKHARLGLRNGLSETKDRICRSHWSFSFIRPTPPPGSLSPPIP